METIKVKTKRLIPGMTESQVSAGVVAAFRLFGVELIRQSDHQQRQVPQTHQSVLPSESTKEHRGMLQHNTSQHDKICSQTPSRDQQSPILHR